MSVCISYARTAFLQRTVYRGSYLIGVVTGVVALLVQYYIWQALCGSSDTFVTRTGMTLSQIITYILTAQALQQTLMTNIDLLIGERVRGGGIAIDLSRPMRLGTMMFMHYVGHAAFGLVGLTLPIYLLAVVVMGASPPTDLTAGVLFLASMGLAAIVMFLICYVCGLFTFWTHHARGINNLRVALTLFFSGALIPLDLFPTWLRTVADLLPFQTLFYLPLRAYLFGCGPQVLRGLVLQCGWIVILLLLAVVVGSMGLRKITVQGG